MGEQRNNSPCGTCSKNNTSCPGHFGTIELPFPIYNKVFATVVLKVLQSVCVHCSRPRMPPDHAEMRGFTSLRGVARLRTVASKCKEVKKCPWEDCSKDLVSFSGANKKDQGTGVVYSTCGGMRKEFPAGAAFAVLSGIPDDHLESLGFNGNLDPDLKMRRPEFLPNENYPHVHHFRPESMILTILPVLPTLSRPWVLGDGGERKDDDLTNKYDAIVKLSCAFGGKSKSRKTVEELKKELTEHVWTLMDNKAESSRLSSGGRAHKSLSCRLRGKGGRIQSNVGGKRCDFSARSVIIGGGIRLRNDELGVPDKVASVLTKPVLVGPWNLEEVQELTRRGRVKTVERKGVRTRIRGPRGDVRSYVLEPGDVAERELEDGDVVLFNRQPTLRIESMMSFRVKRVPYMAFVLGLCWTPSFNADFDGDEMNLHVPQSIEAEVEIMVNSRCAVHVVSSQANKPVNGIVQDGLVASFLLTKDWEGGGPTLVRREDALRIWSEAGIDDERVAGLRARAKRWWPEAFEGDEFGSFVPGPVLLSALLPPSFSKGDEVRDGVVTKKSRPWGKEAVGATRGSLLHRLWKESPEVALGFLSELQQVTDRWLPTHGFSMGLSDCLSDTTEEVAKALKDTEELVRSLDPDDEVEVSVALNDAMSVGPTLAKKGMRKGERNALNIMRNSGAKGTVVNLAQIVAYVGQQNVKGLRPKKVLSAETRCLPSFLPGDGSPEARGFVKANYITGLSPQESFFHAAAGRDGIISTALKTADTGYDQKKLARKMEDCVVREDGSVRNAGGTIVSFLYGGDGMDPKKLVPVPCLPSPFFCDTTGGRGRKLTKEERREILNVVRYDGPKTRVLKEARRGMRKMLGKALDETRTDDYPRLLEYVGNHFVSSLVAYGTPVGLVATSSIAEPTTQMVLNTFHLAGFKGKDASLGVPRFKEIISATKSAGQRNPGCVVATDLSEAKFSSGSGPPTTSSQVVALRAVKGMCRGLKEVFARDLLEGYEIMGQGNGSPASLVGRREWNEEWWHSLSSKAFPREVRDSEWVLRLTFSLEKLFDERKELDDVARAIEEKSNGGIACVCSPNVLGTIDAFVDFSSMRAETSRATCFLVPPGTTTSRNPLVNEDNVDFFVMRDVVVDFVKGTRISGVGGIRGAFPREDKELGEWVVDTEGSNFLGILEVPGVDPQRTTVDDVHVVLEVLGIEAARRFLFLELERIISFDGTHVDPRHLSVLVDSMTVSGTPTAASRDGISRDSGPNAKVLFEKSVDNAMVAAAFGETDDMKGLASSVMYGKMAPVGPGVVVLA